MSSKKEDILDRILRILQLIPEFKLVARNLDEFPEEMRPMAILIDGDQVAVPEFQRQWVKGKACTIVDLHPLIRVAMGGTPEEVGTNTNELEAIVITAIMIDDELKTIATTNGGVYYDATDFGLNHSQEMDCDLQMRFRIRYPLFPTHP